jgi:L-asparagine transporter-like permease
MIVMVMATIVMIMMTLLLLLLLLIIIIITSTTPTLKPRVTLCSQSGGTAPSGGSPSNVAISIVVSSYRRHHTQDESP